MIDPNMVKANSPQNNELNNTNKSHYIIDQAPRESIETNLENNQSESTASKEKKEKVKVFHPPLPLEEEIDYEMLKHA
jgi:hypothetical protein